MKKLFVLLALVSFFACKKSTTPSTTNNNNNTAPPPVANMTASYSGILAGTTYSATNASFTYSLSALAGGAGYNNSISGSAINTVTNETMTIGIYVPFTSTGVYSLNGLGAGQINGSGTTQFSNQTGYGIPPGVGTLTVTTYNTQTHLMSGTFSFTACNPGVSSVITVTNGSFSNLSF
ncbi:MAG TPA: hypothetical protein VKG26_15975 [Bacteroidia bacterium]|nr:hypothetical protein [Bacteroidia bacterium]